MEVQYNFYRPNPMVRCESRSPLEWTRLLVQVTILVSIIIGNSLVIVSILLVKILRQPRNYLVVSLAVADLLVGAFVLPLKIILTENCDIWKAGRALCYMWVSGDILLCTISILALTAISIDRYVAIGKPLFHRTSFTRNKIYTLIGLSWILAVVLTLPYWVLADYHELVVDQTTYSVCLISTQTWYQIVGVIGSFFLPLGILIFVYATITSVLREQQAKMKERPNHPKHANVKEICIVCKFWLERKGCIMTGIVLIVFVICYLPFFTLTLIDAIYEINNAELTVAPWVFDMFIWLGYFHSSLNPLIYTMFNRDFRFAFKELLCLRGLSINSRFRTDLYSKQMATSTAATMASTMSTKSQLTSMVPKDLDFSRL